MREDSPADRTVARTCNAGVSASAAPGMWNPPTITGSATGSVSVASLSTVWAGSSG